MKLFLENGRCGRHSGAKKKVIDTEKGARVSRAKVLIMIILSGRAQETIFCKFIINLSRECALLLVLISPQTSIH